MNGNNLEEVGDEVDVACGVFDPVAAGLVCVRRIAEDIIEDVSGKGGNIGSTEVVLMIGGADRVVEVEVVDNRVIELLSFGRLPPS